MKKFIISFSVMLIFSWCEVPFQIEESVWINEVEEGAIKRDDVLKKEVVENEIWDLNVKEDVKEEKKLAEEDLEVEVIEERIEEENKKEEEVVVNKQEEEVIVKKQEEKEKDVELKNIILDFSEESFIRVNDLPSVFYWDKFTIEGVAEKDVDKIIVEFENPNSSYPKDVFTLSKYKKWSWNWFYSADRKYEVLDDWLNVYTITAHKWLKKSVTRVILLNIKQFGFIKHDATWLFYPPTFDTKFNLEKISHTLDSDNLSDFISSRSKGSYWHLFKWIGNWVSSFYTLEKLNDNDAKYSKNYFLKFWNNYFLWKTNLIVLTETESIESLNTSYSMKARQNNFDLELKDKIWKADEFFMKITDKWFEVWDVDKIKKNYSNYLLAKLEDSEQEDDIKYLENEALVIEDTNNLEDSGSVIKRVYLDEDKNLWIYPYKDLKYKITKNWWSRQVCNFDWKLEYSSPFIYEDFLLIAASCSENDYEIYIKDLFTMESKVIWNWKSAVFIEKDSEVYVLIDWNNMVKPYVKREMLDELKMTEIFNETKKNNWLAWTFRSLWYEKKEADRFIEYSDKNIWLKIDLPYNEKWFNLKYKLPLYELKKFDGNHYLIFYWTMCFWFEWWFWWSRCNSIDYIEKKSLSDTLEGLNSISAKIIDSWNINNIEYVKYEEQWDYWVYESTIVIWIKYNYKFNSHISDEMIESISFY